MSDDGTADAGARDARGPVLVTGCSSGIGRATVTRLLAAGHTVYASARAVESLADLARAGAHTLQLDVTDEESMRRAVSQVEDAHGRVGVLVNNAGYGAYGPVERVPLDDVRRQFETNLFGLGRMCQLVLPAMRAAGAGRIVNVGSMGGRMTFPTGGWYHASKYAVEALSDALRVEVAPFGVRVVLVEPGLIRTGFGAIATHGLAQVAETDPYRALCTASDDVTTRGYRSPFAAGPGSVARVIERAVSASRPRPRYLVTPAARALVQVRRLGGDRVWDLAMRITYRKR